MMVGRDVTFKVEKKPITPGEVVLEVKDLKGKDYRGVQILKGLNLKVRQGEIVDWPESMETDRPSLWRF